MAVFAAKFLHSSAWVRGRREKHFGLVDSAIAGGLHSGGKRTRIDYFGHYAAKGAVEVAVVPADADEHAHLAQREGTQACVIGLVVVAQCYPYNPAVQFLQRVPGGVDADRGGIVDVFLAMYVCHMLHAAGGFLNAGEAAAHCVVAHLTQTGGFDGGKSAVYAGATLFCQ